jgi:hypothetical protein
MNKFVNAAIEHGTTTTTENGDVAYSTSLDACVDMFFQFGALRGAKPERIRGLFSSAYATDPDIASKIALWGRDIRGGAGERQTFKEVLQYLVVHDFDRLIRILPLIPVLGRWDDLFCLLDNERSRVPVLKMYLQALAAKNGLAAKWAPRNGPIAKMMRDFFEWSPKRYRKTLVELTKVVETQMCAREWEEIKYEHVPSVASARYGKAFGRHDQKRYAEYLESVKKGEKKINAGAVYPYDIIKANVPDATADAMWNALPDYVGDGMSFLPIIDVSGSMTSQVGKSGVTCMNVAISLGIYLAERNKSAFNRCAVTFSDNPKIFMIPKGTIKEKYNFVERQNWSMSTNLDAAMQLVVDLGVKNNVPQADMPSHLLVMSDMEFNPGSRYGGSQTAAQRTVQMFENAGYKVPVIVWWNIQSRNGTTPIRHDQKGMVLVSGFSPTIMKSLLGEGADPVKQMLATVDIERYDH